MNTKLLHVSTNENSIIPMPDWARTAVEIGVWARHVAASDSSRLVVCCVVPCRTTFSALVGLGAVAAGGALFEKGFSWEDLVRLEPGTKIFWKNMNHRNKFEGTVEPLEIHCGQKAVPVTLNRPLKQKGSRHLFFESGFGEYTLGEEMLPAAAASDQFKRAEAFYSSFGVPIDSSWLLSSGSEVRFVTTKAAFKRSIDGWGLTIDENSDPTPIEQLLILRDDGDLTIAKSRINHARDSISSDCPVSVLDGPLVFSKIKDIEDGSLVIVLERGEFLDEHRDLMIQAQNEHLLEHDRWLAERLPKNFPASVEITGYSLRSS